jgi:hypothetical protein
VPRSASSASRSIASSAPMSSRRYFRLNSANRSGVDAYHAHKRSDGASSFHHPSSAEADFERPFGHRRSTR